MGRLIYSAITSVDGYVADREGNFDWAEPDEEVHRFVNDLERPVGTYLLGRRMYEVLRYWENPPAIAEQPDFVQDFARLWQGAEKVVYSKTLTEVSSRRTRLERNFDPTAVARLKAAALHDLTVGGPTLAGQAINAGRVDEIHLFLNPIAVGGGTAALPADLRLRLELLDQRRFGNGVVYLRYRPS